MNTGKVLHNIRLENISCMEFGADGDTLYYVMTDQHNRPYKVNQLSIESGEIQTILMDDDPTHYIDISLSKD